MAGIVCDDLDCIMFEGSIISEVWCGGSLLYQYDSTAPALTITAPTGTASGTPTYYTSGTTYRVQGTVSDAESGVAAVYVNDSAAVLSGNTWYKDIMVAANTTVTVQVYAVDKAGNRTDAITRYVCYDSAAPSLAVTAPTGTASGSPTYTTGASYTVSGTVSDASGIRSVTVNGSAASVSSGKWSKAISLTANTTTTVTVVATDNAGRTTTVTRYVRYDSAAPSLAVTAPTGTSSGAPTYYQSDAAVSYTVSGTVSDASGIRSVTVNGSAVTVSSGKWSKALSLATNTTHTITVVATDNAGRTTTVNRYLRVEAYYQYAARVAGTTVQASLDATLKNSTVMAKIAANSTALGVMKNHYASSMNSYVSSNFSDALNLANYKAGLKTYLFKNGNLCTNITGGWNLTNRYGTSSATVSNNVIGFQSPPGNTATTLVTKSSLSLPATITKLKCTYTHPAMWDTTQSYPTFTLSFGSFSDSYAYTSFTGSATTRTSTCSLGSAAKTGKVQASGYGTTNPYGSQELVYTIREIWLE